MQSCTALSYYKGADAAALAQLKSVYLSRAAWEWQSSRNVAWS